MSPANLQRSGSVREVTLRLPGSISIVISLDVGDRSGKEGRGHRQGRIKLAELSASEAQARQSVREVLEEEARSVWGIEHEEIPHPFPGMESLTIRSLIVRTKLFKVINKVKDSLRIFGVSDP